MLPDRVEWPTVAVAFGVAAGLGAILRWHDDVPVVVTIAALAVVGAWYNSLQHEVIHGHPTPWRWVNTALVSLPLGLVVPFAWYRSSHLAHHRDENLTDPDLDPESFYVSASVWAAQGVFGRAVLLALRTLTGRMLLGPPVLTMRMCAKAWKAVRQRPAATALRIGRHLAGVAVVLTIVALGGLDLWVYVVGAAWLGWSLSLMRSFTEHRYVAGGGRSAVVRAGPVMSLLYLNNNLHLSHHARPGVAWYALPAVHEQLGGDAAAAAAGAGVYDGYLDVARRFALRPFLQPVHPSQSTGNDERNPSVPSLATPGTLGPWST